MYSNQMNSTYLVLQAPSSTKCILSGYSASGFEGLGNTYDKPKPCSSEKFRPSAILCAEHLKSYFNLGIKHEVARPSDNSQIMKFYSLKYTSSPDMLLPFPLKLRPKRCFKEGDLKNKIEDFEFCIDQTAMQSGYVGACNFLPPQILGSLLSNSHLSDVMPNMSTNISVNPGVNSNYQPLLLQNIQRLDTHWERVHLLALCEQDDPLINGLKDGDYIKIPMTMLPAFYKFIFYHTKLSNIKSTKTDVLNEFYVLPPNLLLNLDNQAFEIINKGTHHKIFTYGGTDGIETITTPVVLLAEKSAVDINREISNYNLNPLINNIPVCM